MNPGVARLRPNDVQIFNEPTAASWVLDPPNIGVFDAGTTTYTAPGLIEAETSVTLKAFGAAPAAGGAAPEIGAAVITLAPALKIIPNAVELIAGQQQPFRVDPDELVSWGPVGAGKLADGVYTAPRTVFNRRSVTVVARPLSNPTRVATAVVTLQETPSRRHILAIYWIVLLVGCTWAAVGLWTNLCTAEAPPPALVSPPIVTMSEGGNQSFVATVPGTSSSGTVNFHWSVPKTAGKPLAGKIDPSTGVYEGPPSDPAQKAPVSIPITATNPADSKQSASATVIVAPGKSMELLPPAVIVHASQAAPFAVKVTPGGTPITWKLKPDNIGTLEDGVYFAPTVIDHVQTVTILAKSHDGFDIWAAANVTLVPSPEACSPKRWLVLCLTLAMGAIGGLLHAVSSYTNFVGNRQFDPSWFWWYFFRPLLGAVLAFLFFFVLGSGLMAGEGNDSLTRVALIAGLVGLFSDQATEKLKELVQVLLTTKSDSRGDKLGGAKPSITKLSLNPSTIVHGAAPAPALDITGATFPTGCSVTVNGAPRNPTSATANKITIALTAADIAAAGMLKIAVIAANGDTFGDGTVTIT